MTDQEKVVFKKFAHDFVDRDVPALIAAEELRLPDTYRGLVQIVMASLLPALIAALDKKIDEVTATSEL